MSGAGAGGKPYGSIVAFYESCLERHGDSFLGVGWTKRQEDAETRYRVMLEAIREPPARRVRLLDFGCGAAHLLEHIRLRGLDDRIDYSGLDVSERFLALARSKFPGVSFYHLDVLAGTEGLPSFDYVVLNGVFTVKRELSFAAMRAYFEEVVVRIFARAERGIAFNVMSKQVDWERADLFHLSMDELAAFLARRVSRHFVLRHDYGLYEYAAYVYHAPAPEAPGP